MCLYLCLMQEHRACVGMSEVEARYKYTHMARSLKTYGITFFLVKVIILRLVTDAKLVRVFKPSLPVGTGGGYMFSGRPSVPLSVRACVRPSVRDSRGSFMFPRYLQYLLTDYRQTFVTGASWDTDDLITFLGQKFKVHGHTIAAEAHSTRRYRRVQLFLV